MQNVQYVENKEKSVALKDKSENLIHLKPLLHMLNVINVKKEQNMK